MADAGVSGQQTQLRLQEVALAYRRAFAWNWCFPFLLVTSGGSQFFSRR